MRAAVMHEARQPLTIETLEVAKPAAHEVLLRTAYAGLCHSDRTLDAFGQRKS